MAIDIYSLPAVAHGRASVEKYRAKIESGIGQAQTLAEIGGSSYLTARLSAHLGGPEGKSFLGVPLELAVGAACGALAMSGSAGKHTEDILAVGVGAIAAYTARLGFQAGLQTARPPLVGAADAMALPQVGAWPQPMSYALPPPQVPALLPSLPPYYVAPPQPAPAQVPYYPPPPVRPDEPPLAVVSGPEPEEVGADTYASATAVLDQIARSGR
ncbi:MAG: hypothetical protein U1E65_03580 [Myxococcota bacterium]